MPIASGKTAIIERNVLLERFLTYQIVFKEYFKTMDLIERGEALKYETYTLLIDNYLLNMKNYSQLCTSFIEKYSLQGTIIEEKLNNYFSELLNGLNCMDLNENKLNRPLMESAISRIKRSGNEFVSTIGLGIA